MAKNYQMEDDEIPRSLAFPNDEFFQKFIKEKELNEEKKSITHKINHWINT